MSFTRTIIWCTAVLLLALFSLFFLEAIWMIFLITSLIPLVVVGLVYWVLRGQAPPASDTDDAWYEH
jgi:fatty acid desaturase